MMIAYQAVQTSLTLSGVQDHSVHHVSVSDFGLLLDMVFQVTALFPVYLSSTIMVHLVATSVYVYMITLGPNTSILVPD